MMPILISQSDHELSRLKAIYDKEKEEVCRVYTVGNHKMIEINYNKIAPSCYSCASRTDNFLCKCEERVFDKKLGVKTEDENSEFCYYYSWSYNK